MSVADDATRALIRVAKWRFLFTGWQLGSRPKGDPEGDAVRDHRESTIMQQVQANALASLLMQKRIFTLEEFQKQLVVEADGLGVQFEHRFPGVTSTDDEGLQFDDRVEEVMKDWLQ